MIFVCKFSIYTAITVTFPATMYFLRLMLPSWYMAFYVSHFSPYTATRSLLQVQTKQEDIEEEN